MNHKLVGKQLLLLLQLQCDFFDFSSVLYHQDYVRDFDYLHVHHVNFDYHDFLSMMLPFLLMILDDQHHFEHYYQQQWMFHLHHFLVDLMVMVPIFVFLSFFVFEVYSVEMILFHFHLILSVHYLLPMILQLPQQDLANLSAIKRK